ncbi:uncharacterized protein LOC110860293 [Folsomia candida]|uniref:uncharacterized protein LOC110860293 n=1 Tax=Folsomia candida TaxID=158441 RepID=UPI001605035F|nr:uncharacterized protein LOC110860293 [Folsomia candida]
MPTPRPVCLFCRTGDCNSSSSLDLFPKFLTYLATINIPVENSENFCRENFHCCQKCGSLLEMIAHHVHQLGQNLLTIYRVTLQNLNQNCDDDDEILENWRTQSVSQFNTSISLGKDFLKNLNQEGQILPEIESDSETEMDQAPFKIEIDSDEFDMEIKPEIDQDQDPLSYYEDNHSPPEEDDDIPPEEDDESYLNDILELADDADEPPVPSKRGKKGSSRKRKSIIKPEVKLPDKSSIPGKPTAPLSAYVALFLSHDKRTCAPCDVSFPTQTALKDHISAVHLNGARRVCAVCMLGFLEGRNYQYHIRKCNATPARATSEILIADVKGIILGAILPKSWVKMGIKSFSVGVAM